MREAEGSRSSGKPRSCGELMRESRVAVEHRKKGQGKEVKGRNEDRTRKK
jgi:hypothetical protein